MRSPFGLRQAGTAWLLVIALGVVGCGGGSSSDEKSYTVGGTVTGLSGTLVLQNNGKDDKTVTADGPFAFATKVASGATYTVTVKTQPASQTCVVTAGASGTIGNADVTNVTVVCTDDAPDSFAVGGSVGGLLGSGLELQLAAGGATQTVSAGATSYAFANVPAGTAYEVTVTAQPTNPAQTCTVANASGTVTADVDDVDVTCTTNTYTVGGTVTGLTGGTLVLQNNGADDRNISLNGSFTFATPVASGATYSVTVKSKPSSQTCTVTAGGSGTIGNANVTNVTVVCTTNAPSTYTVGGSVSGLAGSGMQLQLRSGGATQSVSAGATSYVFANVPAGTAYSVTVTAQPTNPSQTCTVANATGTVSGNVSNVNVTCTTNTYTVGGNVTGLSGGTLVLQNNGADDETVTASGPFTFATKVASGATYSVTVKTQPAGHTCEVTAGGSGTVGSANVTNVAVTCVSNVVQRWEAPATWGALWQDGPTMIQHAYFDGDSIVSAKGPTFAWAGTPAAEPAPRPFDGFPSGRRWGGGPFVDAAYVAPSGAEAAALNGDFIVCAVVKPDYNPVLDVNGTEKTIIAKGIANGTASNPGGGWVLMQMHHHFCFHYQFQTPGGGTGMRMAATPTYFHDHDQPKNGPLNASYVVLCAGRAGDEIVIAANSYERESATVALPSGSTLDAGVHDWSIGGSETANPDMAFGGRIYETAVWAEPATPANIEKKLAAFQGLLLADGSAARYTRNREGPYKFDNLDGEYHTAWRHGPRIDPVKGVLFGLQSWNRVISFYVKPENQPSDFIATGESLEEWNSNGGASLDFVGAVEPPGDSEQASSPLVTLPGSASLSTPLAGNFPVALGFDQAGAIHGQIWVRVPQGANAGTLRVRTTTPAPGGSDHFDIDLAQLDADTWTRVWLYRAPGGPGNELTTDGSQTDVGEVFLENPDPTTPIEFHAWGLDLTQIAGGGALGAFDPGPEMYEGSLKRSDAAYALDALKLPVITRSTDGFCLSVDAQPAPGMPWNAPFAKRRMLAKWTNGATDPLLRKSASLYIEPDGKLFFEVTGTSRPFFEPGSAQVNWAPGSKHTVMGCVSASGQVRLYADGNVGPFQPMGATVTDPQGGFLLIGGESEPPDLAAPFQGYISKALLCVDDVASCN